MTSDTPIHVSPQGTFREETHRLLRLAWPIVVGQVGLVSMGLVDIAVSGRAGEQVLAAVGAGRIWSFGLVLFGFGAIRGLEPIYAQAHGAGNRTRLIGSLGQTLAFVLLLSVPIALAHLACGPVLTWMRQPPEIIPAAAEYCAIRALGVPGALGLSALTAWLQGQGRVREPMVAVLVGNVVNLVLDLLLVRGAQLPLGLTIPAMGAVGCAWATTGVEVVGFGLVAWACWDAFCESARMPIAAAFDRSAWRQMLRLGLPVGGQTALEVWAFNASGLMVGAFGAAALSAHVVAMQVISFTFMVPFGLGAAASARVGNLIGARQPWLRAGIVAIAASALFMSLSSLVLFFWGRGIARGFTDAEGVLAVVAVLLPVAAAFQVFDGVQATASGVLRGAGDTRFPSFVNAVAYWVVGLPISYVLSTSFDGGPAGVWSGLAIGLFIVSIILLARLIFLSKKTIQLV